MPASGPVYQPTTVSYENDSHWASPAGFLAQNGAVGRAKCIQWVVLALGLVGVASGLIMIIEGSVDFSDNRQEEAALGHSTPVEEAANEKDIVVIIIGALLLCIGLAFVTFYLMVTFRRRGFPCFLSKEQRMARALRPQSANGQGMNPSTDLLVAAQYAPVSEIAYHPPAVSEEEEMRKLMGSDNKDCILKESNSVISLNQERFEPEDSPVPRKLHSHLLANENHESMSPHLDRPIAEQDSSKEAGSHPNEPIKRKSSWKAVIQRKASTRSRRAPLAAGEEITPSLSSSYSSIYFNNDDNDDLDSSNNDNSE